MILWVSWRMRFSIFELLDAYPEFRRSDSIRMSMLRAITPMVLQKTSMLLAKNLQI